MATGKSCKVAVLDDYQGVAQEAAPWASGAHRLDVEFFRDHISDEEELLARLKGFEVVVAMRERTPLPATLLSRLPALKLVVTTGMHNAVIEEVPHVLLCGTRALATPTAEAAWALILGLARNLRAEEKSLRSGTWQQGVGAGLSHATLGILGLGRIGSHMAKIGQAFGMRVIAWSQNISLQAAEDLGVEVVSSEELFRSSDFLTVHLRLSDRTRGLVDESSLRSMKPTSYLINTARAAIVDQPALVTALWEGWIAGAGIDVFDQEPVPANHPLLEAPNTLLTPHIGYVVKKNYELFYGDAYEDVIAYLEGKPLRVIGGANA